MSCMYVSPYVCMLSLLLILVPLLLLLLFLLLCCCCCTELCKCSSNTCLDERISIETASQVQRHCHNRIYPLVTLCVCVHEVGLFTFTNEKIFRTLLWVPRHFDIKIHTHTKFDVARKSIDFAPERRFSSHHMRFTNLTWGNMKIYRLNKHISYPLKM